MISTDLINKILSSPVGLDIYLRDTASRSPTHGFLGHAAQGCYLRQVELLSRVYKLQDRDLATVHVLDWGAGKGHVHYLLRKAGFDVVSCDLNSEIGDSSFAQETPIIKEQGISVVPLGHPWLLPFPAETFDLVVSFGVLEHVEDDLSSLKEIRRVLKPGGMFFFAFLPGWLSWTQRLARARGNSYHPILYKPKTVEDLAEAAGFKSYHIWYGQLFPKNSVRHSNATERIDRFMTAHTPLKYFATNLEGFLIAD